MINIYFKTPIPACDRNKTIACETVPIIDCDNTKELVLYVRYAPETKITLEDNCIIIEGQDLELVRAVDRLLYQFYEI